MALGNGVAVSSTSLKLVYCCRASRSPDLKLILVDLIILLVVFIFLIRVMKSLYNQITINDKH